jgi:hypothetical protein
MIEDDDQALPIDLEFDLEEVVDLDALFDALNIAAKDGTDSMNFAEAEDGTGILTVSGHDLNIDVLSSGLDDLGDQQSDLMKTSIVSDES